MWSLIVICFISVSDHMQPDFHDIFRPFILGWNGDLGYNIRVHGQELNSFRHHHGSRFLAGRSGS
jgi:hypothetical protein